MQTHSPLSAVDTMDGRKMYARNTNGRSHPEAACQVDRETLVPGGQ